MLARSVLLVAGIVLVASAAVGGASAGARVSAPLPTLSSLVLSASDFRSGGTTSSQSTSSPNGQMIFMRLFKPGSKLTTMPLVVLSQVTLEPDAETAASSYTELFGLTQSAVGRKALAHSFTGPFLKGLSSGGKTKVTVKRTIIGRAVTLSPESLRVPITLKTSLGTFTLVIEFGQVDRVLSTVFLVALGNRPVSGSDAALAMSLAQKHVRAAFTVASTALPTIAGVATSGQTLTVDEGTWTGAPSRFDYIWSRCDATGAACLPIDGATGRTYAPTALDVGATLRAATTGANSVGSLQATSEMTAIVS
jgi:hypothetical protein